MLFAAVQDCRSICWIKEKIKRSRVDQASNMAVRQPSQSPLCVSACVCVFVRVRAFCCLSTLSRSELTRNPPHDLCRFRPESDPNLLGWPQRQVAGTRLSTVLAGLLRFVVELSLLLPASAPQAAARHPFAACSKQ